MSGKEMQLQFVQDILNAQPGENELYKEFHHLVYHDFVEYADGNSTYHQKSSSLMRLQEICRQLELVVVDSQFHQKGQVAVAGCFSSGKSAFINSFFQRKSVRLPIDSTPTTSIASYVVDGPPAITGFAYNGGRVAISPQLFKMFRHGQEDGFEFNVKKIVSRIVVSTPWSQSFSHLCLVDTPGFNSGGQERDSDDSAALASIATADGVVWCVSVEAGTLPDKDCELLLQLRDLNPQLQLFLVLTHADIRALGECQDTLQEVADILEAEGIAVEGICLYSSRQSVGSRDETLWSLGWGKGLEDFLRGIPPRSKERLLEPIQEVFRGYREADKVRINTLVQQRKDLTIIGNLHYAKVDELQATVSRQKARLAALGDDEVEKREKKVAADSTEDAVWQSPSELLAVWRRKLGEEIAVHERDMQAADALCIRMTGLVERIFLGR